MNFIETERLILREWTLDDVPDQVEGLGNVETAKNLVTPFHIQLRTQSSIFQNT